MGKHIPFRMCVACRQMEPKDKLVKIVNEFETQQVKIDKDSKLFGRGAYICPREECLKLAMKKKAFERIFKQSLSQIYEQLQVLIHDSCYDDGNKENNK